MGCCEAGGLDECYVRWAHNEGQQEEGVGEVLGGHLEDDEGYGLIPG